MSIEKILEERNITHGDYGVESKVAEAIKDVLLEAGYKKLPWYVRNALDLIATKISRLVCGNFKHLDHYDDISGYAQLVKKELFKESMEKKYFGVPERTLINSDIPSLNIPLESTMK